MTAIVSTEELRIAVRTIDAIFDLELGASDVTVIPQTGYTNTAPIVITSSEIFGASDDLVAVTNISHDGMFGDVLVAVAAALTPDGETSPISAVPNDSETFQFDEWSNEKRVVSADRLRLVARFVEAVSSVSKHSAILFSTKQEGIFATYGLSEIGDDLTSLL